MTFLSKFMEMIGRRRVITDRSGRVPYLIRYYIFLKDRKKFPFNITLHKVLVSDEPKLHLIYNTDTHLFYVSPTIKMFLNHDIHRPRLILLYQVFL